LCKVTATATVTATFRHPQFSLDCSVDAVNAVGGRWQCDGWIGEAAVFLQGISREAPHCATTDDVDRLIKKIETYRMDGYKDQDARLNAMDRIVTDLYGIRLQCAVV